VHRAFCQPASKDTLKRALWARILEAESEEVRDAYRAAYLFLSSFLSGVGLKGIELSVTNIKEWGKLSEIMNTELNELKEEIAFIEEKALKERYALLRHEARLPDKSLECLLPSRLPAG
jgi:hypothetical protein